MRAKCKDHQAFTNIYRGTENICLSASKMVLIPTSRVYLAENSIMPDPVSNSAITIRDLTTIAELEAVLRLEKEVWGFEDADVTPLTLAVAMQCAGSIWLGAFRGDELVGFALAFPSLEHGKVGFHSHTLAVHPSLDGR